MNILVTGGCGFIGSNFVNYMIRKHPSYRIINIDAMYYCASKANIAPDVSTSSNYKFIHGNINDSSLIRYILSEEKITHIIHFAAQSHVDSSFENSIHYTTDNVKGTHTLLECVREVNPEIVFLHFSTDEVYGESQLTEEPKHEMSLLCPTNPYAASKAAAEMFVNAYIHSYKMKCIITRCNNVYGPNQYPEKLIPKFIELLKAGKKCTIHGDGSSLRSFIHVFDVCTAVDIILHKGAIGEIYNIGSSEENEISVIELTKQLINIMYPDMEPAIFIEYVADRPFNDRRYFITNEKVRALGWEQSVNFREGLMELVSKEWDLVENISSPSVTNLPSIPSTPSMNSVHSIIGEINSTKFEYDCTGIGAAMF
jgi:UDP-glucose 4,6-dehydratase